MPSFEQPIKNALQHFPVFEPLAIRQDNRQHPKAIQRIDQLLQIQRSHGFIGHNCNLLTRNMRSNQLTHSQQAGTDMDGITAIAKINLKCPHDAP